MGRYADESWRHQRVVRVGTTAWSGCRLTPTTYAFSDQPSFIGWFPMVPAREPG